MKYEVIINNFFKLQFIYLPVVFCPREGTGKLKFELGIIRLQSPQVNTLLCCLPIISLNIWVYKGLNNKFKVL